MMTKKYSIGIDIGGTTTSVAIVSKDGSILDCKKIHTSEYNDESFRLFTQRVSSTISSMTKDLKIKKDEIVGVGIGAPCANGLTGIIEGATDLPWASPIMIKSLMEEELQLQVYIDNDANLAATGEHEYGAAKGHDNFIMITLGTGVGSGIFCNGKLVTGANGLAGELGHTRVGLGKYHTRMCSCGRPGCVQTYCNASGIVQTANELLKEHTTPSLLRDIPCSEMSPKTIFDAAEKGDEIARETFEITGDALGTACAEFAAFSNPSVIVLFGGITAANKYFMPSLKKAIDREILFLYRNNLEIKLSELPSADAALLGASALPWSKVRF